MTKKNNFKFPLQMLVDVYEDMQWMTELSRERLQTLKAAKIKFKPDDETGTLMFMEKQFNTKNWHVLVLQMRCCNRMPEEIAEKCEKLGLKTKKGMITKNSINVYLTKWKKYFVDAGHRYPTTATKAQKDAFQRFDKKNIASRSRKELDLYKGVGPDGKLPMTAEEKKKNWLKRVKEDKKSREEKPGDKLKKAEDKLVSALRRR